MRYRLVISEMLIGLRRNLSLTLAVIVTVGVSLVLVGAALMLSKQVDRSKGYWYDKVQVTVSLCTDTDAGTPCESHRVTDPQRHAVETRIRALPEVENVFYESQADAFKHFKEQFKNAPDLIGNVQENELPEAFQVKLKDPKKSDVVISAMRGFTGVGDVRDQRELLAPLFRLLHAFQKVAISVAIGVLLAAIALIVNTIRIAVFSRRREIGIMRLVGASNLYIELPFLLEGAFAGLVGALISVAGVFSIQHFLVEGQLKSAAIALQGQLVTNGDVARISFWLLILGVVMSTLVAFLTLTLSRATRV
jgi:cell division transport system permease protein